MKSKKWSWYVRNNILNLKRSTNLTTIGYCDAVGLDYEFMYELENGRTDHIAVDELELICNYHGVKPSTLVIENFYK